MERFPYIPPMTRVVPVQFDTLLCAIVASNDPYVDNGDYDWDPED